MDGMQAWRVYGMINVINLDAHFSTVAVINQDQMDVLQKNSFPDEKMFFAEFHKWLTFFQRKKF